MSRSLSRLATSVLALALVAMVGCSSSSETSELSSDPTDVTIAGPRPTAPPSTEYSGRGLSADATKLVSELSKLETQDDLCQIITAKSLRPFLSGDFDAKALVVGPTGIAQLVVAIDSMFRHIVDISPPEVQPATAVIRDVWKRVARIEPDASDREARINVILAEPEVGTASRVLADWVTSNCAEPSLLPTIGT